MKIRPEDLTHQGFVLLDKLDHKELVSFIQTYIKKKTKISLFYTLCNLLIAGALVFLFWWNYGNSSFSIGLGITHVAYGLALAFALIPVHEFIHVLAYKWQGADNTSYDVNWKKFYFMAIADRFVANNGEFRIVALAPFVVISTVLIIGAIFANPQWTFTLMGTLLAHTAFSSGDFGLLSYFEFHSDKIVVTFDEKENAISYFYGKNK